MTLPIAPIAPDPFVGMRAARRRCVAPQDKRATAQADEATSQNAGRVAPGKLMSRAGAPVTVSNKLGNQ